MRNCGPKSSPKAKQPAEKPVLGRGRVSEKQEIVQKVHFVFLRNTRLGETCVMLAL
jgi:hypothetical protein